MPGGLRQRDGYDGTATSSQGSFCRNSAAADRQFPAVIVAGPRREGKQTLLRQIFSAAACIRDRGSGWTSSPICPSVERRTPSPIKRYLASLAGSDATTADVQFVATRGSSPCWPDRPRSAGFFSGNLAALLSGFGEADGNCLLSTPYDSTLTTLS